MTNSFILKWNLTTNSFILNWMVAQFDSSISHPFLMSFNGIRQLMLAHISLRIAGHFWLSLYLFNISSRNLLWNCEQRTCQQILWQVPTNWHDCQRDISLSNIRTFVWKFCVKENISQQSPFDMVSSLTSCCGSSVTSFKVYPTGPLCGSRQRLANGPAVCQPSKASQQARYVPAWPAGTAAVCTRGATLARRPWPRWSAPAHPPVWQPSSPLFRLARLDRIWNGKRSSCLGFFIKIQIIYVY